MAAIFVDWLARLVGTVILLQSSPTPDTHASPPPAARPATSEAERIARARDDVQRGEKALLTLQKRLDDPAGEYPKAEVEFQTLDRKATDIRRSVARLRKDGQGEEATKLEATLRSLDEERVLARERFDLAIRQRKLTHEAIAGLKVRVAKDQELLDQLEGKTPAAKPAGGNAARPSASDLPADHATVPTTSDTPVPATSPTAKPATLSVPAVADADPVVQRAREALAERKAEQRDAEVRSRTAEDRVKALERSIKTSGRILQLEQESTAQAEKMAARLTDTLATNPPSDLAEQQVLADRLADARTRMTDARDRAKRIADRMIGMEETLKELRDDATAATRDSETAVKAAADAEAELDRLLSPWALRNLTRWAAGHGPTLIGILVGMLALHLITRHFSRHIVRLVARENHRGSEEDRENRGHTLVGVFRYAAGIGVFGGGTAMLLDEIGVPIIPLMGGAAVLGLAVAFGAQNLIRDYFTGFMMLLEDQYSVNDVVRIGAVSGRVKQITLRVTVLRDQEGGRHVIPHGTIASISNLTHGWSRALFEVPVAYKEDVDRVIAVLTELGRAMRADPTLGVFVLEEPEMLGVDTLADSGVVIKFYLKTRPLKQGPIKREMLRRIKNRFDELGIEMPFPHRTVYHRFPDGDTTARPFRNEGARKAG